ncbi:hypothetical protein HY483_02875 [Candidatus Woesearchaeota archaeon]|nr:hypothetical protein [Candidatus Woesearchaeota archaeon]
MGLLIDLSSFVVVSLGLIVGHHIARLSRSELKNGQPYLLFLERFLFSLTIYFFSVLFLSVGFSASISLLVFALLWEYPLRSLIFSSLILGVFSGFGSFNVLTSSMLYFLVRGSQNYYHKEHSRTVFVGMIIFISCAIIISVIFPQ